MQKIFCLFRRAIAKTMPQDMAAGRAGGTVTVKRSRVRSIIIARGTSMPAWIGRVAMLPTNARTAMMPTNLKPSE